jgi:hypothetical protein
LLNDRESRRPAASSLLAPWIVALVLLSACTVPAGPAHAAASAPGERQGACPDQSKDGGRGCKKGTGRDPGKAVVDQGSGTAPPQKTAPGQSVAPAPSTSQPASEQKDGYTDPFASLGARSPFCGQAQIGARAAGSCRLSGAIAHPYPLSSYGLDVRVGFSLTHVENNLLGALQSVAALVWMGLVYLLKGVLLMLEWAFSLDLIGDSLPGVRRALITLHERVIGEPWLLFAIAVAGLWGIWRGLVQRRTIETLGGLAVTVLLMVAALVVIADPSGTVGYASKLSNEGSLGILSATSSGRVKRPAESFSDSIRSLFDSLVLEPWCALEFGDVEWCIAHPKQQAALTNADVWLAFPAQSGQRESLYKLTKGEPLDTGGILGSGISFGDLLGSARDVATGGPLGQALGISKLGKEVLKGRDAKLSARVQELVQKDPERVRIQEGGGTFPRIALLALIAVGMLGATALLAYVGVRLLLAAILSLILLLLAPAMLLAPAFGESGRATFVAWAKRLVGALAAKLVYALLLALLLIAAAAIASLRIGWFGTWLLEIAFWWGVLLKRKDLVGLVSAGRGRIHHGASGARRAYRDAREAGFALGSARRRAARVSGLPVLALARRGHERGEDRAHAVETSAREELGARADDALRIGLKGARATLARNAALDGELRDTNRGLAKYDTQVQIAKQRGDALPMSSADEQALLERRALLESSKDRPEAIGQAQSIAGTADRNLALKGAEFTDHERAALVEQRRRDIESGLANDHERSLRFAGIDPRAYDRASPQDRKRLAETARAAVERDQRLLAALPERDRPMPGRPELKQATIELPPERLRERARERRQQRAQERFMRRRRERLYRQ